MNFAKRTCCAAIALMVVTAARADEGMWLFNNPPRKILKERYNFEPTDAWLEHLQKSSVRFNSGGSGSFISKDGLVITNHHVGADDLQKLSPKDKDYLRDGYYARSRDQDTFLNANETGPHTPGVSVECARWLAQEAPVIGFGVETVGTDAGAAHSFDPPFPCHSSMLGADKYGLTQLQNLALLPPQGAMVIVSPLPITGGSGSPCRALALVERA